MGLSLEFYAGDADAIGKAFTEFEFDGLGALAAGYADFSLHLSPTDLDLLSEAIAEELGMEPRLLNDCLVRTVGGVPDNSGAEVVSGQWVRMVASLQPSAIPRVTAAWIARVSEEYGESLEVVPAAVAAVTDLVSLCRTAEQKELAVVHTWYL